MLKHVKLDIVSYLEMYKDLPEVPPEQASVNLYRVPDILATLL